MDTERAVSCENGVKLYYYQNNNISTFAISLYVRYGVLFEAPDENGFAHFFEHAVFRNINSHMEGKLYTILDSEGLSFNACTYTDYIEFRISGSARHFQTAARVISLILSPFCLSASELYTEKKRIKAEIREEGSDCLDYFSDRIVYKGTPLSRTIPGKCGDISRFGLKMLRRMRSSILSPENIFFYVGGNFTEYSVQLLADLVSDYPLISAPKRSGIVPIPKNFGNRDCTVELRNAPAISVKLTFDIKNNDFSIPEIYCLDDLLFAGESSPVHTELSENSGLIYSFESSSVCYQNISVISVSYDVRADCLMRSLRLVLGIFASASDSVKTRLPLIRPLYTENAGSILDDADSIVSSFGYMNHILGCRFASLEDRKNSFASVTAERVAQLAKQVFRTDNLVIALNGSKRKTDTKAIRDLAKEIFNGTGQF